MRSNSEFEKLIPDIVSSVKQSVSEVHGIDEWQETVFTNLQSADGSAMIKLRVKLNNGDIEAELYPEREIRTAIYDLWESMLKQSKDIWYGFKLTVYPDGKHEIEYNYDPNCIDDPKFIDF